MTMPRWRPSYEHAAQLLCLGCSAKMLDCDWCAAAKCQQQGLCFTLVADGLTAESSRCQCGLFTASPCCCGGGCQAALQSCAAYAHASAECKLIACMTLIRLLRAQALGKVLPAVAQHKVDRGGYMILRPDSGDPTEAVLAALHAAEDVFGADVNAKGYKVPRGCGVIQGDGIGFDKLGEILDAVLAEKYSAQVRVRMQVMRSS